MQFDYWPNFFLLFLGLCWYLFLFLGWGWKYILGSHTFGRVIEEKHRYLIMILAIRSCTIWLVEQRMIGEYLVSDRVGAGWQ